MKNTDNQNEENMVDKETSIEDKKDAQAAVEAKKSLGRGKPSYWWRKGKGASE